MTALFRKEAMEWKGSSWLGVVQLRPKASSTYYAYLCLALIVGFAILLTSGTYSQRLKLGGTLIADPAATQNESTSARLLARFVVPANVIVTLGSKTSVPLTFMGLSSRDQKPLVGRIISVTPVMNEVAAPKGAYFAILVQLPQRSVAVGGHIIPLSAGLSVSADILIEKRTLLAWLRRPRAAT